MSNANNAFYSSNPSLLTLKGEVSVHFLDGEVIDGEFATQDAFNIFLTVEGEPMMIPRSQIRYIKGKQGQQIEEDTSQAAFSEAESTLPPIPPSDRLVTEEYAITADDDEDDGTVVLALEDDLFIEADEEDEDDGTVVLTPDILEEISGEEDEEDEDDGTVVLTAPPEFEAELDAEDATVIVSEGEESAEISAHLVCIGGPHTGQTFELKGDSVSIGRSSDNGVVLSGDKEISRHHAIISRKGDKFTVQDNDSLNGTFVNDEPVAAPRSLENNDIVVVGISALKYQEE